jgi:rhodanese-related sulfurtransferase
MAFSIIYPRDMQEIIRTKRALVLDVREREAYRKGHWAGAANLPYAEMEYWISRIPKNKVLILYCEYGSTSLMAARQLGRLGYEVFTVVGGIHAIREENLINPIDREN